MGRILLCQDEPVEVRECTIRVLVVDDDPFVRRAVTAIVVAHDRLELVGEAADGIEAIEKVGQTDPDVILMDLMMPRLGGLDAVRQICRRPSPPRVLILTNHMADSHIAETLREGAAGFLLKNTAPSELVDAIIAAQAGDPVLSAEVTGRMIDLFVSSGAETVSDDSWAAALTEREKEVALAVADGRSNQEIADLLFMSLSTVKTNVSRILAKLGLANRVQVALLVHGIALHIR